METETLQETTNTDSEKIVVSTNMEEQEFEYQDTSQDNCQDQSQEEELKYTKIDCLDEDPEIAGQRFACVSFISPEGIMNCKTRGFKIKGVYGSINEARTACAKFQKMDKYFDIYVAEVGKWCPWDPTPQQVKETVYGNKTENKIMKSLQEKELENLNEIVGRQKENIDGSKISHKNRMVKSMKENVASLNESQEVNKETEKERDEKIDRASGRKPQAKSQKGQEAVRDRLKKLVEQQKKTKEENNTQKSMEIDETLEDRQAKLKIESQRIREKEENTIKLKQVVAENDEKVMKLKEFLNQKKLEKQSQK